MLVTAKRKEKPEIEKEEEKNPTEIPMASRLTYQYILVLFSAQLFVK